MRTWWENESLGWIFLEVLIFGHCILLLYVPRIGASTRVQYRNVSIKCKELIRKEVVFANKHLKTGWQHTAQGLDLACRVADPGLQSLKALPMPHTH